MNKRMRILSATLLAGCALLFSGCSQVDDTLLNTEADFSVNIAVPYSTTTPLPDFLNVPDQVIIDANGGVTVNDSSLLNSGAYDSSNLSESGYNTLSLGDTNTQVQQLQQRLKELGYYAGGISGVFDVDTQAAVRRFEKTFGVMQTGIATPAFQARLFSDSAPVYGSEAYDTAVVSQYSTLQRGAVGSSVYALQQRLKELGYPIKELTGVYDTQTEQAISMFSAAYGFAGQKVAYIALQKELYSDSAISYTDNQAATSQSGTTALSVGNVGMQVMKAQTRLIELGYMTGSASGVFDGETEEAVRRFEQACQSVPTGRLTSQLQNLLFSENAPRYGSIYASDGTVYSELRDGSEGSDVMRLQQRLIELGYAAGSGNGVYGSETATAVRIFQRYNGLQETGVASSSDQALMFSPGAISYQDVLNGVVRSTPAPVSLANATRTLTQGTSGSDVSLLQSRLNELGYTCSTSGIYDSSTANAVSQLQSAIGISQNGLATPSLQAYIQTRAVPPVPYTFYNSVQSYGTLQLGDTGEAVTRLQQALWSLGYLLTNDVQNSIGTFHDKTYNAVVSAQRAMGYSNPDGIATQEFQCFLFSPYSSNIKR